MSAVNCLFTSSDDRKDRKQQNLIDFTNLKCISAICYNLYYISRRAFNLFKKIYMIAAGGGVFIPIITII